jgi:hypothetical protein
MHINAKPETVKKAEKDDKIGHALYGRIWNKCLLVIIKVINLFNWLLNSMSWLARPLM